MNALVTGGSGFVGSNLVRRLLDDGHEIHLAGRVTSTWRVEQFLRDVELHAIELTDGDALRGVVRRIRPDWVFHLAAHGAYSWQTDVRRMIDVNLTATVDLLEAAISADVQSFLHAGTSSEYGHKDHAPAEDEPLAPESPYAVTKAAASLWCANVARTSDVAIAVLRLYSVYGPWEEPGRFVPALVAAALRGALPPLAGPRTARDFVYAADVADAFVRAAAGGARGTFNVGTGVQTTLADAVACARAVFAVDSEPEWDTAPARTWDTDVWIADPRRIQSDLGWRATTSLGDGLRATARWLQSEPALAGRY